MDLTFMTDYYIPIVFLGCSIVGYCIKNISHLDRVSNQYIPSIMAILGIVLGCWTRGGLSLENVIAGAISGLASTGAHQAFKQLIEKGGK